MTYIKKYRELYESMFLKTEINDHAEWLDKNIIQYIIDKMKPGLDNDSKTFIITLRSFNNDYPIRDDRNKRMPHTMGKRAAEWIDMELIQDVIDRMNPHLNLHNVEYIENLKSFLEGE